MTADEAVVAVVAALEEVGNLYVLVGSLATNFHGVPRSTRDADIVVAFDGSTLDRLAAALPPGLRIQPQTSFETVTGTIRHIIEVRDSPFIIELFGSSDDPHDRARLARRQRVRLLDRQTWVLTAEDVVITNCGGGSTSTGRRTWMTRATSWQFARASSTWGTSVTGAANTAQPQRSSGCWPNR